MMPKKIFTFIFPASLAVILVSVGIITWLFSDLFSKSFMKMTKDRLFTNAMAMRDSIEATIEKKKDLKNIVAELAKNTNDRITIIAPDGTVLADSKMTPKNMENHATTSRKEVMTALNGKIGSSVRYSSTLMQETIYVAIPVHKKNGLTAVIRTSFPLKKVHDSINRIYIKVIALAVAVAIIACAISFFISKKISTPLENLKNSAARFAKGDFSATMPESSILEIRNLTDSMNTMSHAIRGNIEKITQQKNHLKLILSNMQEGVVAVDTEGRIITMNRAAKTILNTEIPVSSSNSATNILQNSVFSYPRTDPGRKYEQMLFEEVIEIPEIHKLVNELLVSGTNIRQKLELKGAHPKTIAVHGAVLRDYSGSSVGYLLVVSDITEIAQVENMRRNFASNVSHELKTPLTAIKGAVETLLDGAISKPDDAERFLKIIYKHSERLNALINDIMSLSKIESENSLGKVTFSPCRVREIINTAFEICTEKAADKKVSLLADCDDKLFVRGNREMLEQVFVNLIDNALKYSPENEVVKVEAARTADYIAVSVTDHGCGIPEEHISRLFERFYRIDKGRSRNLGGTGLGLAIVKHIINTHKGTVEVVSRPGIETIFTVKLPITIDGDNA